ncbi:MAG TPA: hypothetical protein VKA36_03420, partial [Solirubrobacterales bacterium]|nr:hypothetical protein [Solirubrobacterales bacterium]
YRPFEGGRSVYVIEAADAMAEESQNALLKTLEEPPPYAHLLLISSEPDGLLETVRSRCARVPFAPLPRPVVEARLAAELGVEPASAAALAALADGDLELARFLGREHGSRLRELTEACCRAARGGDLAARPWTEVLEIAEQVGKGEGEAITAAAAARAEEFGKGRDADRVKRDGADAAKRAERRTRTASIDVALALVVAWFTDLAACADGAPELVRNSDRRELLSADAEGVDPAVARSVAEHAMEVRRRLQVNVKEELALESLFHRASAALGDR